MNIERAYQPLELFPAKKQALHHCLLINANELHIEDAHVLAAKYLQVQESTTYAKRQSVVAKKEFVVSRLLAKYLAKKYLLSEFQYSTTLALQDFSIVFNESLLKLQVSYQSQLLPLSICLSHSGGYVLLYVSTEQSAVGVDIEKYKESRDALALAEHFFHPQELPIVQEKHDMGFYRLWTLKEALAKVSKQGVADLLATQTLTQLAPYQVASSQYYEVNGESYFDISFIKGSGRDIPDVLIYSWPDIKALFLDN